MSSSVIRGPWVSQPAWFVSLDGGGTVRKAFGSKTSVAAEAAATIWREMCQSPLYEVGCEPSDAAFDEEVQRRLQIFTPEAWTEHCVREAAEDAKAKVS
jgi:hypothetical protein